jgi:hypothetical protein
MTAVAVSTQEAGISNFSSGHFTGAAGAVVATVGFAPRFVQVIDSTTPVLWQWQEGMAATHTLKTTTAAADDTGSAIVVDTSARTITFSATLAASSAAITWIAFG